MSTQTNFENALNEYFSDPKELQIRIKLLEKTFVLSFEKFISICSNSNLDTKMNVCLLKENTRLLSSSSPRIFIESLLSLQSNPSILNQNIFTSCKTIMDSYNKNPLYESFCYTECPMDFEYY